MIPDFIEISKVELIDGEPKEVSKKYFYEFNFNAGNAFRRAEGLDYSTYMAKFSQELDQFEISEGVGKFFFYALEEGMRIMKLDFDLTIEDVLRWVNNEAAHYQKVINGANESAPPVDDKKKAKASH